MQEIISGSFSIGPYSGIVSTIRLAQVVVNKKMREGNHSKMFELYSDYAHKRDGIRNDCTHLDIH